MRVWQWYVAALALTLAGTARAETVQVGLANTLNDSTLYVAADRGYFRKVGLDVNFVVLDSGGKMIAPLGSGQLDVGSGAVSAGLYNAIERGVGIRIVADRGRTAPGILYQTLFVRKSLIDSGAVKTLADLKGKKFAAAAPGVTSLSVVNEAAKAGGISYDDIEKVYMAFPQQVIAMKNGAIDFSTLIEPFATVATKDGIGVRWMSTEKFYPGNVIGTIFFGEQMASQKAEMGRRFIKAYLLGVRDFVRATSGGKLAGPGADGIIEILQKHYNLDPALMREMYVQAVDINGVVTADQLRKDWIFFREQGLIKGSVPLDKIVDRSFVDAALQDIGRK
jgi:NitT/TauT family transport system substrate-binding protein